MGLLPKLTLDQEVFLKGLEDKGYDPSIIVGGPDWATNRAVEYLRLLRKCRTAGEELEFMAAALRLVESEGVSRGSADLARALGVPKPVANSPERG